MVELRGIEPLGRWVGSLTPTSSSPTKTTDPRWRDRKGPVAMPWVTSLPWAAWRRECDSVQGGSLSPIAGGSADYKRRVCRFAGRILETPVINRLDQGVDKTEDKFTETLKRMLESPAKPQDPAGD